MKIYLAAAIINSISALFSLTWILVILTINGWAWFNWINVAIVIICGCVGLLDFMLYKNELNKKDVCNESK